MIVGQNRLNLNGLWDYAIVERDDDQPKQYDRKILAPFPVDRVSSYFGMRKISMVRDREGTLRIASAFV